MKIIGLSYRRKGLTLITLEDKSELLLDTELVQLNGLVEGKNIENIQQMIFESDLKRAKSRALWYLSRQDHSEKALLEKLKRGGFSDKACSSAVDRMKELDLIDDQRYAENLAEYLSSAGVSRRELYFKLINKGISSDLARGVLSDDETDEVDKIKALLYSKYAKKLESEEGVQKVFAALIRKGFSFSDVKDALKDYSDEINNSEEY